MLTSRPIPTGNGVIKREEKIAAAALILLDYTAQHLMRLMTMMSIQHSLMVSDARSAHTNIIFLQ